MTQNERYMSRALELAELGKGAVSPNPMVGCVIVLQDKIIGEGYHQLYGGPHAEVNAINSVKTPADLSLSTAYVTLEPCAHWGKTPPCAHLLVEKGIRKVVIAALDSNPLVAGKGVDILQKAGIEVVTGILESRARIQNKRFFTQQEKQRPYVILKWAQSQDGFLAKEDYSSKWISNTQSRQLVHKWRAEEDAILVGKNTALHDNPSLTVRDWTGKNPIRIVLDPLLKLPNDLHLYDRQVPTLCFNTVKAGLVQNLEWVKISTQFEVSEILAELNQRKIQSLIVEGGAFVINQFIKENLWDEARVFTGPVNFESGILAPILPAKPQETISIQEDLLYIYHNGRKLIHS
jgi:diaminohydroxyphosphoribosylaminopyrimidine deaminase/5-amino-6-(5-phosphoribosylamino)uracil reductase